jgi:GTPase
MRRIVRHIRVLDVLTAPRATNVAREHFQLAVALDVPIYAVVTMVDGCTESHLQTILCDVVRLVERDGGRALVIRTAEDVARLAGAADAQYVPAVPLAFSCSVGPDACAATLGCGPCLWSRA